MYIVFEQTVEEDRSHWCTVKNPVVVEDAVVVYCWEHQFGQTGGLKLSHQQAIKQWHLRL